MVENNNEQEDQGAGEDDDPITDNDCAQDEPVEQSGGKDTAEKIYDEINSEEIIVSDVKDLDDLKEAYDALERVVKRRRDSNEPPG